jgi:hypothetical protein
MILGVDIWGILPSSQVPVKFSPNVRDLDYCMLAAKSCCYSKKGTAGRVEKNA